jgi:adenylate cyclase
MERRLAAILAADVAGYSRLMGHDEEHTLSALRAHRDELIDPLVSGHGGKIVKTMGDGFLMEFPSVVEAVACAIQMQRGMAARNRQTPEDRRMVFRVGIHVGDIMVENGDVFGDGVNIAARLEQNAQAGEIWLSEDAYRQVRDKLEAAVREIGPRRFKNIEHPIGVYSVDALATGPSDRSPRTKRRRWLQGTIAAGAAVLAASALTLLTPQIWNPARDEPPAVLEQSRAATALPVVGVLPFANLTGDDDQAYFADGVTEEVINALGHFNVLRVIGRHAMSRYQEEGPADHSEIATQLGARYLVDGSVRRSSDRIRVSAQLTDVSEGTVLWSNRYEGQLSDIFDFQDSIARDIAGTLAANIAHIEGRERLRSPAPEATAFDLVLRARAIGHAASRSENRKFRELVSRATALDPNYAVAHALLAEALYSQVMLGWTEFVDRELARAEAEARRAIQLAPEEPDGYRALGRILLARTEYDQASNVLRRAIELNPSDANALAVWGSAQCFNGEIAAAVESLELALKFDPMLEPNHVFDLAVCHYLAGHHADALRVAEGGMSRFPDYVMFNVPAAASAAQLGRNDRVTVYLEVIQTRIPYFDVERFGSRFKDPEHSAYLREGLERAGL